MAPHIGTRDLFSVTFGIFGRGEKSDITVKVGIEAQLSKISSMQEGDNWMSSRTTTFSAMDQSYSLPNNIAVITLQVKPCFENSPLFQSHELNRVFMLQELQSGKVLLRLAHLYEVLI